MASRSSAPKRPAAKKPAAKKVSTKKPAAATASTRAKSPKASAPRRHPVFSFRLTNEDVPFLTFRVTRQSLYWLVFAVSILALGAWNIYLNMRIMEIYDQIDQSNLMMDTPVTIKKHNP